ncbi:orotidine-5'-phosphate decarboxylase [Ornithinibacillus sp. L9]|uniref:Orotidine 5'-phosphate decarboxylase n=1 Tax=Ornithinibacillus caprae TaxID=2678566 RepID=A0A6N8FLA1_9BACI|nr:orotidine-5'-phosphate decarboxylase [Ornithinibacillus caprae]MUK89506.1 orotidine-5'-phosphate decarboxylase [Ornithinibacillus caprae]
MNPSIYLALDFPAWEEANLFIERNGLQGVPVKVGMELFYREGPAVIERLKENNHEIFLDLKLHDIPTTVMRAMRNIATLGVDMVNVHALGGSEMIQGAKEGLLSGSHSSSRQTKLIAVTMLTSMDQAVMNMELLIPGDLQANTVHFAQFAAENGADGVVCSVHEAKQIKSVCGPSFLTVTPGIRLMDTENNDQKRVATPQFARENGSDILVVGRSVTQATNPKQAYLQVLQEWGNEHELKS